MSFQLTDDQIIPAWSTLTVEVIFAPKTGAQRPWELYGNFTYPVHRRVFWGSYKTEASAQKGAAKALKNAEKIVGVA
jgi:hypothetical protein